MSTSISSYRVVPGQIGARVAPQRTIEGGGTILLGRIIDVIVVVGRITRIIEVFVRKCVGESKPMSDLYIQKRRKWTGEDFQRQIMVPEQIWVYAYREPT